MLELNAFPSSANSNDKRYNSEPLQQMAQEKNEKNTQTNRNTMTAKGERTKKKLCDYGNVQRNREKRNQIATVKFTTFQNRCESITISNNFFFLSSVAILFILDSRLISFGRTVPQPHHTITDWIKIYNRNENQ